VSCPTHASPMDVPQTMDKSAHERLADELRALEPTVSIASSPAARAFKGSVRALPSEGKAHLFGECVRLDCINVARCMLVVDPALVQSRSASRVLPAYEAALSGSVRCLKAVLDAGTDVSFGGALHAASFKGHAECVRLLLKHKAPLEERAGKTGHTPLMYSAYAGHEEVCAMLIKAGARVCARNHEEQQPLHFASQGDNTSVVQLLLAAGADIESRDKRGRTPLFIAARFGCAAAIRFLLDRGANANVRDQDGSTPLMVAVTEQQPLAVSALLAASELSIINLDGKNVLHACVAFSDEECLELLLPHVTDAVLEARSAAKFGHTALHLAILRRAMMKPLLRHGAARSATRSDGSTPLLLAALTGDLHAASLLLGPPMAFKMSPAEVNMAMTASGYTALHSAAGCGHIRVCGRLMQAGARLDATCKKGDTPLALAQQVHPLNAPLHELLSGNWAGPLPGSVCERCAAAPDSLLMYCSGCHSVSYCCPRCATADWPRHAAFCMARKEAQERESEA
jgi:uncharacterized protein